MNSTTQHWFAFRYTLVALILCLAVRFEAFAQNNSWTNTGSGFWQDAVNWSAGAPSSSQLGIFITNASTKTVTIDDTTTNSPGTLTISNLTVSAPLASINTLELVNAGSDVPLHVTRGLSISNGGALLIDNSSLIMDGAAGGSFTNNGTVTVLNGGLLVTTNSVIGSLASRTGTFIVASSTFTNLGVMTVGSVVGGRGEMVLSNSSAFFSGGTLTVGTIPAAGGGYGSLTIFGGTSIFSSASLVVGVNAASRFPTGTVLVTGGALVSMTNNANSSITISSRGSSEMTITNASVVVFGITVGNSGTSVGRLNVDSGGILSSPVGNGVLRIGDNINSTGLVNVAGGTVTIRDGVEMGRTGFGQLIISNGTFSQTAASGSGVGTFVGFQAAGGYGILKMLGGTTTLTAPVGIGTVAGATGIVEIAGGNVTMHRSIGLGSGGYGEMTISGGTSTFATVSGTILSLGGAAGARGVLTVSDGQLSVLSHAVIGLSGTGSMTVAGGTVMMSSNVFLGTNVAAEGTLVISGGNMVVTNAGHTATLDLRRGSLQLNGGTLTVSRLAVTNSGTGLVSFNSGTLNVRNSTVTNTQAFVVGDGISIATLNLLGGTNSFADGLTINTNGYLKGNGTIVGDTTVHGTLTPGQSPGLMNVIGNLTLAPGSTNVVELNGTTAGVTYDHLNVQGTVDVSSSVLQLSLGFSPTIGNKFVIISNDAADAVNGTFLGLAEGSSIFISAGGIQEFQISYLGTDGSGNDVVLTFVIPEPSSALLLLGAALLLVLRSRRGEQRQV